MEFGTLIQDLLADPLFALPFLCIVLSVANFVIGSIRAAQNDIFEGEAWHAWIKKDGGDIAIIVLTLLFGKAAASVTVSGLPIPPDVIEVGILGLALMQAGTFVVSKADALKEKIAPNPALKEAKAARAAALQEPIPEA